MTGRLSVPVVHACPPSGSMFSPCCQRPPFELPRHDRITGDPDAVTCWTTSDPRLRIPN